MYRPLKKLASVLALSTASLGVYARAGMAQEIVHPFATTGDANSETHALLENFTRALAQAPFTVLGDTNHKQPLLQFLDYDNVLEAIQKAGKKYIGLEDMSYAQGAVDQLAAGKIDETQYVLLRIAQMNVRNQSIVQDDAVEYYINQANLILAAHERGIGIIMTETLPGVAKTEAIAEKKLRHEFKAYSHAGNKISLEDYRKTIGALTADVQGIVLNDRTLPSVNDVLLANMIDGVMTAERKAGGTHLLGHNTIPPFMIFIGAAHAEPFQEAAAKRGLGLNVIYLLKGEEDVAKINKEWSGPGEKWEVPPEAVDYIVWDTLRWHKAPAPAENMALPVVVKPKMQLIP